MAVLAVDPSSKRSGGSLLGDRARIDFDPSDRGVLIRSTAAGERLGGLARATRTLRRRWPPHSTWSSIETVGVGQAETEVADVADTVCVVVQPGRGDVLQFLKSGIMEIPDVLVVTKADLGQIAQRARRDLNAALRSLGAKQTKVVAVSSLPPAIGTEALIDAIDSHASRSDLAVGRAARRRVQALGEFADEYGRRGMDALGGRRAAVRQLESLEPGGGVPGMVAELAVRAGLADG